MFITPVWGLRSKHINWVESIGTPIGHKSFIQWYAILSEYATFFSWVCFTYLVLMCVMFFIRDIFSLIHHDHFGLTYHGGYWVYWPKIKISTSGARDCDSFHLLIRVVPYPYPYTNSVDLMTYPFWKWEKARVCYWFERETVMNVKEEW